MGVSTMNTLDVIDWYWGQGEDFELPDHLDNVQLTAQCRAFALCYDARPGTYGAIYQGSPEEDSYATVYDSETDEQI